MDSLYTSENLVSFFVLVVLEIVLGIDNVIFVSIIMNRLPFAKRKNARVIWMISGMIIRSVLLCGLSWLLAQKGKSIFSLFGKSFDLASLVMLAGGLFLIYKTVKEIHAKLEGEAEAAAGLTTQAPPFMRAIMEIILIDTVFSFDSIITAGGTAKRLEVMIAAVVVAMIVMFLFSPKISTFIHKHPTLKMLALSFLVMIGFVLLVEGWDAEKSHDLHLKNYVYFAMAFSFIVELLNMQIRKKYARPVQLHERKLTDIDPNDGDDLAR
jgi:predicted tellurium resistance membrane protein TerC